MQTDIREKIKDLFKRIFGRKKPKDCFDDNAVGNPDEIEIEALPFSPAPNTICEKYKTRGL